jgi:3D (Asp-Asp-Asp) domain-containing protein
VFVHPLFGSYDAKVENLSVEADAENRSVIRMSCTFVEDGLDRAAFEANTDESVASGVQKTEFARDDVDTAIAADPAVAALDPPITVQNDAVTTAEGWRDTPGITPRQVNLQLNRVANQIIVDTERLELATRLDRYPLFLSMQRLHSAIRRAADLAIETGPRLTRYTVGQDAPLLAIMATIYGGAAATAQYAKVREQNDIENPARVPAGTSLTIEQP